MIFDEFSISQLRCLFNYTQRFRRKLGDSISAVINHRPCCTRSRLLHQQIEERRQCRTSSTCRTLCRVYAPLLKCRMWPSPVSLFHRPSRLLPPFRLTRNHHHFDCQWYCCCLQDCGFVDGDGAIPWTLFSTVAARGQM